MIEPPLAPDETGRIASLNALGILDTPPEERFDRITRLAQKLFDVPIAVVSLVDVNRQWFKSCQGLGVSETPRGISFCGHAVLGDTVFVVENALTDPRFADNPLVTGGPGIRFYAGAPLKLHDGHTAGTLCIISPQARSFGLQERERLAALAEIIIAELENVQLAARERELRDFIETAGAIIQSVNSDGTLLLVNRAWQTTLGYARDEAIGKNIFEFVPPDEHAHCRAVMERLQTSASPIEAEVVFTAKDGRRLRLFGMLSAVKRSDGTMSTRGVFQDVTAQRELERIRSEVTHHVSHELKTPIAVTTLALSLLAESPGTLNLEQRTILGTAQRAAAHLARMAEDLLDSSKSESGKLRVDIAPNDLAELLGHMDAAFKPLAATAGLELALELSPRKHLAHFDPVRVRQILSNLLGNAMKFTPKGGRITLGAKEAANGFIEVFVRDNGVGIKSEDADRIFDRLYQTTNKALHGQPGLGLGLHICRELAVAHGGRIWVESTPGKGASFHFTLPSVA